MPVFPDDTEPKNFSHPEINSEWMPWIGAICYDPQNKVFIFVVSLQKSSGYYNLKYDIRLWSGSFNWATKQYNAGILTTNTGYPRVRMDYHVPHTVRVDIDANTFFEATLTFRGPPLWYSKIIDKADMVPLTHNAVIGGYDAPLSVTGTFTENATPTNFSGYGICEHVWLLGIFEGAITDRRWLWWHNSAYCGIILRTVDPISGLILARTGRVSHVGVEAFTFDDFVWEDDGSPYPRKIVLGGPIKDLTRQIIKGSFNIATDPLTSTAMFQAIWRVAQFSGSINPALSGECWSEVQKVAPGGGLQKLRFKRRTPAMSEGRFYPRFLGDRYL